MKNLYNKNFKTLEKEIEEDSRSWKDSVLAEYVQHCENDCTPGRDVDSRANVIPSPSNVILHRKATLKFIGKLK